VPWPGLLHLGLLPWARPKPAEEGEKTFSLNKKLRTILKRFLMGKPKHHPITIGNIKNYYAYECIKNNI